ncbi:MAG: hypothetical protein ACK4H7_02225 [Acidilobaceae archaeon]
MSRPPDTAEDSPEKKWVALMVKSAKKQHKLCPYFDKKTFQCLLMATVEGRVGKCNRDGKFEGCPIFTKFLEKVYGYYTGKGKTLPRDFQDVVSQAFTF